MFETLLWWMLFAFVIFAIAIGQAIKGAADITKKAIANEKVQEAGKSIFAAWLESRFKQ